MPLTTDRLYLELFGESEAVHLLAALLHESVYEGIRPYATRSVVEVEAQLAAFREGILAGGQLHWVIRDQITHSCLGSVQATMTPEGTIAIGYRVRSEEQNKGIATAALVLLVKEISLRFPNFQIIANVHPRNIASLRVLAKSSFVPAELEDGAASVGTNTERVFRYHPPAGNAA